MIYLVCLLALGVVGAQNVTTCEDVDTNACKLLVSTKSDYCADEALSKPTCPRYCGYCPKVCYHCDVSVTDFNDCNTTKVCQKGEICMIKQLRSTVDGHHEYLMSCEDKQVCDGTGLTFGFGKRDVEPRDVSVHCCSDDLCNYPEQMSTTTVPTPVSMATGCSRDIMFMIDTTHRSIGVSHGHLHLSSSLQSSLQLVHDIVAQLTIGPYDNLVSLATFDSDVHNQWDLDDHYSKSELLKAIANVRDRTHHSSHGDINDAVSYLLKHVMDDQHGDRSQFPDDVIIITDSASPFHNTLQESLLQRKSRDVIIISVGQKSSSTGTASDLATDDAHKLHVDSYSNLPSIGGKLFSLLCS